MGSEKILAHRRSWRVSDAVVLKLGASLGASLIVQGLSMWAYENYVRHGLLVFALLMTYLAVSMLTTKHRGSVR